MDIVAELHQRVLEIQRRPRRSERDLRAAKVLSKFALPDYKAIRQWLIKHHPRLKPASGTSQRTRADQAWSLARLVVERKPLSQWEKLPAQERRRRLAAIDKLATGLAKNLVKPDSPPVPAALELFQANRIPATLFQGLASEDGMRLAAQPLAPMLGRLALFARRELAGMTPGQVPRTAAKGRTRQQARPRTGAADARAFACELADWFEAQYGIVPNEVVASVHHVGMPDHEFDADKVRQCRGRK